MSIAGDNILFAPEAINSIKFGWLSILCGIISGALIGLFFHKENFLDGYCSFNRRLVRLGHIAFMGLGFTNIIYGLTALQISILPSFSTSFSLKMAALTMPLFCFLTAWKELFRHGFFIPVVFFGYGVAAILIEII